MLAQNPAFKETFLAEAYDYLNDIEETVLSIEQGPDNKDQLDRLYRCIHTIKGSSAMFGFDAVSTFAHRVENVLDALKKGRVPITQELIDLLLAARDHIRTALELSDDGDAPRLESGESIAAALEMLMGAAGVSGMAETMEESHQHRFTHISEQNTDPLKIYRVRYRPDPAIFQRGGSPQRLLEELRQLGECVVTPQTGSVPPLETIDPERCYFSWDAVLTTSMGKDAVEDVFIFETDGSDIQIQEIESAARVRLDSAVPRLGDILVDREDAAPEAVQNALARQKRIGEIMVEIGAIPDERVQSALREQQALKRHQPHRDGVRVPSERLDELINLVGEMVVNQARLNQCVSAADPERAARAVKTSDRLVAKLRDCTLDMRMMAIGTLFSRFRRLVRDLSHGLGKEVDFSAEGAETEMDKTVIERLADPLLHLIRNSLDHGIEGPEEREANGKPRKGALRLLAFQKGDRVILTLEDDGRGIDTEKIRQTALKRGLLSEAERRPDADLLNLLFLPGFSTQEKVTTVSGRGVGMDVVKREIEALGGTMELQTSAGKGMSAVIAIPLTLAIVEGLLVRVGAALYVIPLSLVVKCAEFDSSRFAVSGDQRLISMNGEIAGFTRLREFFGIRSVPASEHLVIVVHEGVKTGIVVDEIIGTHQTLIKSLGKVYRKTEGLSGATIMGDGSVVLILDIPAIVRRNTQKKTGDRPKAR